MSATGVAHDRQEAERGEGVSVKAVTARVVKLLSTDSPLERQAVVDVNGISVVLTARRRPFHEIKDFTILGLDPTRFKIVVVWLPRAGNLRHLVEQPSCPSRPYGLKCDPVQPSKC